MDGFGALGIDPTTDLRAIKRAYAGRLKITRPEDDPAAFQRLHQAYRKALDWADDVRAESSEDFDLLATQEDDVTSSATQADDDAVLTPAPAVVMGAEGDPDRSVALRTTAPAFGAATITVVTQPDPPDPHALLAMLQTAGLDGTGLSAWLETHLFALHGRRVFGNRLLAELDRLAVLPAPGLLLALIEFFGWQPLTRIPTERRVLARAAALLELHAGAAQRFAFEPALARQRSRDRSLLGPFSWWRSLLGALWPGRSQRMLVRLDELDVLSEGQVERVVPVATVRFWRSLAPSSPLRRQWLVVALVRSLLGASLLCAPGLLERSAAGSAWVSSGWQLAWCLAFIGIIVPTACGVLLSRISWCSPRLERWVHRLGLRVLLPLVLVVALGVWVIDQFN